MANSEGKGDTVPSAPVEIPAEAFEAEGKPGK